MSLSDILTEWDQACFFSSELLSQAYTTALDYLRLASAAERRDPRLPAFLQVGYAAYLEEKEKANKQDALIHELALRLANPPASPPRSALDMVGGGRKAPAVPEGEPSSPRPGPSRSASSPRPASPDPTTQHPNTHTPTSTAEGLPTSQASPHESPDRGTKRQRSRSPTPEPALIHSQEPTLEVLQSRERYLERFKTTFREEVMNVTGLGDAMPSEEIMVDLFDTILARQREALTAQANDRMIMEIENGQNAENPIWFNLRRVDQINGRVILDKLTRVLNSNQNFMANGQLKISYIHIPTPEAGGRQIKRVPNESMDQWLERKISSKTIFSPDNNDNLCLTRCVAVAMAKGGMSDSAFCRFKKSTSSPQFKEAIKLCELAGIDTENPCGLDEVHKLQDALPDYRLCVFTDKRGKECIFKGEYSAGRKNIYLVLHNAHFYVILYPCQAFEYKFECAKCAVCFEHKGEHKCEGNCWRCLGPAHTNDIILPLRRCTECSHQFAGDECYEYHKTQILTGTNSTKCNSYRFCLVCETSYSRVRGREHVCGFVWCRYCKSQVQENHLCFMQPWEPKKKRPKYTYHTIFFDIETVQETEVEGKPGTFAHVPNLLVSHTICDNCQNVPQNDYFCTKCKTRQHIFHNLDDPNLNVMSQFLDYLQSFPEKTELLLIAHNMKSFDGVFVLEEMIKRKLKPELVLQGAKIISMELNNWKFIDSLMFLPMPLSSMPKSFGLTELKKGYWPFLANKPEFYKYEGPLLDRDFYCVSGMKSKAAAAFNSWYDEQVAADVIFNFRKELVDYCISDVTILRQSCQAFRQLFTESAGFDPLFNCITLSSACMAAYRTNFLQPDTIGIVPPGGYHGRGKQSYAAIQWLTYEQHKLGRQIKTIHTDREVSVFGRRVDGYVEIPLPNGNCEKRIYQFHGDYWHQCPVHFPPTPDSGDNRYEKTVKLTSLFRRGGYTVIEKWECEWNEQLMTDPEVKDFFDSHPVSHAPPLNLRAALCGGRTNAMRWYHKANLEKGETIKMADVVSEYPNANLRGEYPVGHPSIFLEDDPQLPPVDTWNGIVKCTVLPTRDLFLPVLPYKCNGKLMFPLCRSCVEAESKTICKHNDPVDRQITGEWCAPEIKLALQKGYSIVRIHEVYQYPRTMKYNPETDTDGLLSAYVRRFMALKIQASGWPAECDTEEKKQIYIADVKKYDGIVINSERVEKNPALRTLAKLILNSFWGKFGEKTIRPKTELIYDYAELMRLVVDPTIKVNNLIPLGEHCLQVSYLPIEDTEESHATSSLLVAAFTTCLGRLQLYSYLDIVKERALYCDTDSVAYISRPGEPDLPLGTHLGDLTDQVAEDYGPGSFIIEFAAGGPKNYAYKVAVGGNLDNIKVCIKVRGITINSSCDDLVTFDNLQAMVMGDVTKMNIPIPRQITRLPGWKIVTRPTSKDWQAKNTKRRRVDTSHTVPHGFNAFDDADEEDQELLEVMDLLGDQ